MDGRRKAAARIKARVKEEERLGIRKKRLNKAQLAAKARKQYMEKPPWNPDNMVGGDGNGEKAFRLRSLNQKVAQRENRRQAVIKRAIVEVRVSEARSEASRKGGDVHDHDACSTQRRSS